MSRSSITIEGLEDMSRKLLEPIPPGEILFEEFMRPLSISMNRLARDIDVPPNRISAIVRGRRAITADTALRLGKYFGVDPRFWLNLQSAYDLSVAERSHDYSGVARCKEQAS